MTKRSPPQIDPADVLRSYQRGEWQQAELLAKKCLRSQPKNALCWKILGSLQKKKGDLLSAMSSIASGLAVTPNDPELHNILGNIESEREDWLSAEGHYRRSIDIKPDLVEAHANLGNVLLRQNRFGEAIDVCTFALTIRETAQALTTLGTALLQTGQFDQAKDALNRAVRIEPSLDQAHINLGNVLKKIGDLSAAETSYKVAIQLDRQHVQSARFNLGILLSDLGRVEDALEWMQFGKITDAKGVEDSALRSAIQVRALIASWVNGKPPIHDLYADQQANFSLFASDHDNRFLLYLRCLYKWLDAFQKSGSFARDYASLPLHVIGESHALSTCNAPINFKGVTYRSVAHVIMGIKMWHLAQSTNNYIKQSFQAHIDRLSRDSELLLTIGEIDCRLNEGIWPAAKKIGIDPFSLAEKTVEGYISHLDMGLSRFPASKITLQGVPAPCHASLDKSTERLSDFLSMIRHVNHSLKAGCSRRGWSFLDVFEATANEKFLSHQQWHLDDTHLRPDFYSTAASSHLYTRSSNPASAIQVANNMSLNKMFLHIGCGPKRKDQTTRGFNSDDWQELCYDIDESVKPDLVGSMTDMSAVADESVDAIFSSHNIEHLYPHEVPVALKEFLRVLKPQGFLVLTCPDLQSVCALVAGDKLTEPAYTSPAGPIAPIDILYGHRPPMANGNLYMAHRCGFTSTVLSGALHAAGFKITAVRKRPAAFDLWAVATKSPMTDEEIRSLAAAHFPAQPAK